MRFTRSDTVVGAHAEGEVGNVIVGGVGQVPGETMFDKRNHLATHRTGSAGSSSASPRGQESPAWLIPEQCQVRDGAREPRLPRDHQLRAHPPAGAPRRRPHRQEHRRRLTRTLRQVTLRHRDLRPHGPHARPRRARRRRALRPHLDHRLHVRVPHRWHQHRRRCPAIIPSVAGQAWITDLTTLVLDPTDPYQNGYRLTDTWPPGLTV